MCRASQGSTQAVVQPGGQSDSGWQLQTCSFTQGRTEKKTEKPNNTKKETKKTPNQTAR